PYFNGFSGKDISLDLLSPLHVGALLAALLLVGLLSGGYPAFILSGFDPVAALKGTTHTSNLNIGIRKVLVVFQFSVSVVLIISSIVVYSQLKYMQQHDLGFNPAQTLV